MRQLSNKKPNTREDSICCLSSNPQVEEYNSHFGGDEDDYNGPGHFGEQPSGVSSSCGSESGQRLANLQQTDMR